MNWGEFGAALLGGVLTAVASAAGLRGYVIASFKAVFRDIDRHEKAIDDLYKRTEK